MEAGKVVVEEATLSQNQSKVLDDAPYLDLDEELVMK